MASERANRRPAHSTAARKGIRVGLCRASRAATPPRGPAELTGLQVLLLLCLALCLALSALPTASATEESLSRAPEVASCDWSPLLIYDAVLLPAAAAAATHLTALPTTPPPLSACS
ncbi:hypothetical protein CDD83_108 [Cordyceps sp. RAO-2017]|nr:hypothetical protein CDD83_108 [Cordyceps sp. RAO-2017]